MNKFLNLTLIFAIALVLSACTNKSMVQNETIENKKPLTIFILDTSSAINQTDAYMQSLKDIVLKTDGNKTNLSLVNFSGSCKADVQIYPTADMQKFIASTENINFGGKSALSKAISKANSLAKNSQTQVNLIIISSSHDTCNSKNTRVQIDKLARENSNLAINSFVIGYKVNLKTRNELKNLTLGNGVYIDARDIEDLSSSLNSIVSRLNISKHSWNDKVYNFDINFDNAKYEIKDEFKDKIKEFATYLIQTEKSADIQGHTDNIGNKKRNKILSKKRADAVKHELIKLGVNENKLSSTGYGSDRPKFKNNTKENRYKNRRVEAHIR